MNPAKIIQVEYGEGGIAFAEEEKSIPFKTENRCDRDPLPV